MGRNPRRNSSHHRRRQSKRQQRHQLMQEMAKERILYLFEMADAEFSRDSDLANKYITLIRKLAMSTKISLPEEIKRRICHNCKKLLYPGQNVRYRIIHRVNYGSYLAITCLECNHITRYIFKGNACTLENN